MCPRLHHFLLFDISLSLKAADNVFKAFLDMNILLRTRKLPHVLYAFANSFYFVRLRYYFNERGNNIYNPMLYICTLFNVATSM